ncbi:hypothetical protein C4544_04430 [candidate division WS5 bacterium]|uniref:YdbS-like PH domain-containing protein n=1 Tax=candidate division WS5 bacterium TaxID=2093353 RepID=A0A419DCG2_9BACT|nr:MAG: hypothetical protein C4544_04430 [candidate division WS5 bacterium]
MSEEIPGQKKKEKHIKTFRRNLLVLYRKFLKFLIFLTLSIFVMTYISQLEILSPVANYINIGALLGMVFSLSYGFYVWMTWHYDVYILTSERVIEAHQKGLFNREVKEIDLEKVQDVTYSVSGFLATLAEIGSVKIKSASGMEIEMKDVSKPSIVREVIMRLIEKKEKGKKNLSADDIAEALARKLEVK